MPALTVLEYIRSADGVWSLPDRYLDYLREGFPDVRFLTPANRAEADHAIAEADIVLGWAVTRENFAHARRLHWIQVMAAGLGNLLFPELVESDVVVTNGRGLHAVSMAEHTIGVMLSFVRKLHLSRDAQREGRWTQAELFRSGIGELHGTTLGIVGLGTIGGAIATRARALGVKVIGLRRRPSQDPAPADLQWGEDRLHDLLAEADWIVLTVPLTPETRGMIGERELAAMKPGAFLVNLGRGPLVDEEALTRALESGRLAGAALDVFEHEPLPPESPLWSMSQVILTPHSSGLGPRYWERSLDLFRDNLTRWRQGTPLRNVIDKRAGY